MEPSFCKTTSTVQENFVANVVKPNFLQNFGSKHNGVFFYFCLLIQGSKFTFY